MSDKKLVIEVASCNVKKLDLKVRRALKQIHLPTRCCCMHTWTVPACARCNRMQLNWLCLEDLPVVLDPAAVGNGVVYAGICCCWPASELSTWFIKLLMPSLCYCSPHRHTTSPSSAATWCAGWVTRSSRPQSAWVSETVQQQRKNCRTAQLHSSCTRTVLDLVPGQHQVQAASCCRLVAIQQQC
jgi:hypothetical protein